MLELLDASYNDSFGPLEAFLCDSVAMQLSSASVGSLDECGYESDPSPAVMTDDDGHGRADADCRTRNLEPTKLEPRFDIATLPSAYREAAPLPDQLDFSTCDWSTFLNEYFGQGCQIKKVGLFTSCSNLNSEVAIFKAPRFQKPFERCADSASGRLCSFRASRRDHPPCHPAPRPPPQNQILRIDMTIMCFQWQNRILHSGFAQVGCHTAGFVLKLNWGLSILRVLGFAFKRSASEMMRAAPGF